MNLAYIEEVPSTLANIFTTPYSNPAWGGACEYTQAQIGNIATNGLLMPKIYVKREYTKAGMIQSISLKPKKGFHLHSAFYNDKGQEVKEGILCGPIGNNGKVLCSLAQSLGYTGQVDYQSNSDRVIYDQLQDCLDYINNHSSSTGGWHIANYQEYCLFSILAMTLKDYQKFSPRQGEDLLVGLKIGKHDENEFSFHTLSKKTGEYVDTGKVIGEDIPIHSWILNSTKFLNDVTEDHDFRDLFVSKDKSKLMFEKLYGDQVTMDYVSTGDDNGNVAYLFSGRHYGVKYGGNCHKVQLEDGSWKYNTYATFYTNTSPTYVGNQKWNTLYSDSTNTFNASNSIKPTDESYGIGSTIASYVTLQDITFWSIGGGSGYQTVLKYI